MCVLIFICCFFLSTIDRSTINRTSFVLENKLELFFRLELQHWQQPCLYVCMSVGIQRSIRYSYRITHMYVQLAHLKFQVYALHRFQFDPIYVFKYIKKVHIQKHTYVCTIRIYLYLIKLIRCGKYKLINRTINILLQAQELKAKSVTVNAIGLVSVMPTDLSFGNDMLRQTIHRETHLIEIEIEIRVSLFSLLLFFCLSASNNQVLIAHRFRVLFLFQLPRK